MTEADAIERARRLLEPPRAKANAWAAVAASGLAAASAVLMAGAVILGPGFEPSPGAAETTIAAAYTR